MKVHIFVACALACFSAPALADDWALTCNYPGGIVLAIKYNAGDSSHSVAVKAKGTSSLPVTPAVPAARLTAPDAYIFIVDRERTGQPNERSLLIRLNTETMQSILEAGNGVSWDYLNLRGVCARQ